MGCVKMKRLEPLTFGVAAKMIDHIGLAMYNKFTKAISELVVNGYDADATKVDVDIKANRITITDNGSGMDERGIREEYMMLASNHKRNARKTPKFGRLPIGNKGIGKLAGLGIAKSMRVITIKDSRRYEYPIDLENIDKTKTLDNISFNLDVEDCDGEPSGTVIELTKIFSHVKIDPEELRGCLAREIPHSDNFQVFVNGKKCNIKDIPAKRKVPIEIFNDVCGLIKGEIVVAKKVLTSIKPGIFTTVRERIVGPPSFFGLLPTTHRFYHTISQLITGRVEVSSFDPDDVVDEIPVIKTDRDGFNEDHPKYKAYFKVMTEELIKVCREEEKELEKNKQTEIEAQVKDALKNVIDDFNTYNKEKRQEVGNQTEETGEEDDVSEDKIYRETNEPLKHKREPDKEHGTNPAGITDKHLREKLKAAIGEGIIHLGNKRYKITMEPLGIDDWECRIDDRELLININISHPAYKQALAERCVEMVIFRAVATAFAWKKNTTSEGLYEYLDKSIRFHAERMEERRASGKGRKKKPF
jgi:hypothetical protein